MLGLCCSVLGLVDKVGWWTPRSFCLFFLWDSSYSIQYLFPVISSWIKAMLVLRSCALFAPFKLKIWWIFFFRLKNDRQCFQLLLRWGFAGCTLWWNCSQFWCFLYLEWCRSSNVAFVPSVQLRMDVSVRDRAALGWEYTDIQWDVAKWAQNKSILCLMPFAFPVCFPPSLQTSHSILRTLLEFPHGFFQQHHFACGDSGVGLWGPGNSMGTGVPSETCCA